MSQSNLPSALGRGLASLIATPATPPPGEAILQIALNQIQRNPQQPRQHFSAEALAELTDSIREKGVLQPLLVQQQGSGYVLIAGERRLRAATLAGLRTVPVIVRQSTPQDAMEVAMIENIQRLDLNPIEEARGVQHLMEKFNLSQEVVAKKLGKNRSTIANSLRLLKLPQVVQQYLTEGKLTPGQVRPLIGSGSDDSIIAMAEKIMRQDLNARDVEAATTPLKSTKKKNKVTTAANIQLSAVQDRLRRHFGTKVQIQEKQGKGSLTLHFYSLDDLNRLLKMLGQA